MNKKSNGPMPVEYEYMNGVVTRAQEHVFLINAEMEKLEGNPVNEKRLVNLQEEKSNLVEGLKRDVELQTFESGFEHSMEIQNIVDKTLSDEAYQQVRSDVYSSGKTYENSNYWQDKYERNIDLLKNEYSQTERLPELDRAQELESLNGYDEFEKD
ncbi:hypothetical protein [Mucilaginibacter pedocola]|uniref:Uncharacterized protein n=1 Tax=Mucilaginibacter pedocola TaxID=1792845 RepID=A0A1S9P8V2_9SPHI|nr:hypothetical protein [Mucilaginibacter pedocola]OOQ57400.1 hypothetical protein BC343_14980 [Mucilaginibacter pedocola]